MKTLIVFTVLVVQASAQQPFEDQQRAQADLLAQLSDQTKRVYAARPVTALYGFDGSKSGDSAYDAGTSALDQHNYEQAVSHFDRVISSKSPRADGALYWKAYALNRIGRRDEGLAAIATLRRDYAGSRWLNDAQVLEAELKQGAGQPVSVQESNEELKLMAINSLMNAEPERALPLLEGVLKGSGSPKMKSQALFVITQSRSPKAQQILASYAKGAGNPDLQIRAIRYLGMSGSADGAAQLVAVYNSTPDVTVKREIIRSLMTARAKDAIFNLAKNEKDESLRGEAIRQLGAMRATNEVMQLLSGSESNPELRYEIVNALIMSGSFDYMATMARDEKDPKVRRVMINALASHGDAKVLVEMARKESDPSVKKDIVSRLAQMRDNKDATDYMMELLK